MVCAEGSKSLQKENKNHYQTRLGFNTFARKTT
jgi:hypothetical protein